MSCFGAEPHSQACRSNQRLLRSLATVLLDGTLAVWQRIRRKGTHTRSMPQDRCHDAVEIAQIEQRGPSEITAFRSNAVRAVSMQTEDGQARTGAPYAGLLTMAAGKSWRTTKFLSPSAEARRALAGTLIEGGGPGSSGRAGAAGHPGDVVNTPRRSC